MRELLAIAFGVIGAGLGMLMGYLFAPDGNLANDGLFGLIGGFAAGWILGAITSKDARRTWPYGWPTAP